MSETYNVNQGGLMRCCLLTLDDEMVRRRETDEPLMRNGDTLQCSQHGGEGMVCDTKNHDGCLRWRWNRDQ
jgi:hypothetical protein